MHSTAPKPSSRVLNSNEVVKLLGVSLRTLRGLLSQHELPFVRVSKRRIGVLETDLATFLERRRVSA